MQKKSAAIDPKHSRAVWLTCSAEDRYLTLNKKPQIWGTQLIRQMNKQKTYKVMVFEEFDKTVKTDKERNKCGIPAVKEMDRRIKVMAEMTDVLEQYRYWRTGNK